jgi:predicted small metal-binding protein
MKTLKCRDLGMDCDHVVTGSTVEEVKQKAFEHAGKVHADIMKTMSTPQQMADMEKLVLRKIQ